MTVAVFHGLPPMDGYDFVCQGRRMTMFFGDMRPRWAKPETTLPGVVAVEPAVSIAKAGMGVGYPDH